MPKSHARSYRKLLTTLIFTWLLLYGAVGMSAQGSPPYKDPELPVEQRVEDLLSRMTLEEKFWQMFMIPGDLSNGEVKYKNGIFGFQVAAKGRQTEAAGQLLEYGVSVTDECISWETTRDLILKGHEQLKKVPA